MEINRDNIDMKAYHIKFTKADAFLKSKQKDTKTYRELLLDPTTFAYLNFKIDGEPVELYPYQDLIANSMHRFKYFRAANQIGKSILFVVLESIKLVTDHGYGHTGAIVSQSLPQAFNQMRRVKALLNTATTFTWSEIKGDTDSMSVISHDIKDADGKVKYTNYLICAPCTEGLLGYSINSLNLDEYEFWNTDIKHFYGQIAEPRTYKTKGNITIFSNPNGAENYGAELERLILKDGTHKFHTYVFDFMDCPGNTEDDLELASAGKDRAFIESTLMAIRSLSDKYYFSQDEVESSYCEKLNREQKWHADGQQTYWFMDVGAKHDQSVLVGATTSLSDDEKDVHGNPYVHIHTFSVNVYPQGYPLSRVVGSFDDSQATDGWHYVKSVKEHIEEYQLVNGVNPPIGVDVTGNSGIAPLMKSVGIVPIDTIFSGPKKWAMYQRMKYFLEKKLFHIIKSKEYDFQMKRIVVTRLKTSTYNRVGHETDDDQDDVPDAVAGVIHMADNPIAVEPTITKVW